MQIFKPETLDKIDKLETLGQLKALMLETLGQMKDWMP